MVKVYVIGSLSNAEVPVFADTLRSAGFEVFDDWYASGPEADTEWRHYESARGRTYSQALAGHAATNTFEFDFQHLNDADVVVLLLPAGRSGHLELGWAIGRGKPGYIVLSEKEDRWDVMYKLATDVFHTWDEFLDHLKLLYGGSK